MRDHIVPDWAKFGALVECIGNFWRPLDTIGDQGPMPIVGETYTLIAIDIEDGRVFLTLAELGPDKSFAISGFRQPVALEVEAEVFRAKGRLAAPRWRALEGV